MVIENVKVTCSGEVRKEIVIGGMDTLEYVSKHCVTCLARRFFRVTKIIDGVTQEYVCWPNVDGDDEGKGACGVFLRKK